MDQLSRPYQIALGALVVFALAWFLLLKPSDDSGSEPLPAPAAAAPGQAGLGSAVAKAQGAVQTSSTAAAAAGGAAPPPPAAAPATGATAQPTPAAQPEVDAEVAPKDPSASLLSAVKSGKVGVVLFSSSVAGDDRKVRRALATADRHGGRVVVRSVPIADVAKWSAITEGVDVLQSPTLLVIGKGNLARRLIGFTDTRGIDQLVADVGGPAFVSTQFKGYRGRIVNLCGVLDDSAVGNALNSSNYLEILQSLRADLREIDQAAKRLDPPRRFVRFHELFLRDVTGAERLLDKAVAAERTAAGAGRTIMEAAGSASRPEAAIDAEAKRVGLDACAL